MVDAFPEDTAPRWLHRDRDGIYGDVFQRRLAGMGIVDVVSAPASPWQNPYVERLIGSIVDPSGSISSGRLCTASEPDILRRPQAYSRYRELCIPPVFRRSFNGK